MLRQRARFEQVPLALAKKILAAEERKKKLEGERTQGPKEEGREEAPLEENTFDE